MHTTHSSSCPGGVSIPPRGDTPWSKHLPGAGTPQSRHPLPLPRTGTPGQIPPQLPPWVWAWTRCPSTSPLVVGLETCKACRDTTPPPKHAGIPTSPWDLLQGMLGYPPPREQNHGRLWKYNLAPTSLRAVMIGIWQRFHRNPTCNTKNISFYLSGGSIIIRRGAPTPKVGDSGYCLNQAF